VSGLVDAILHHPSVQRLEATWRTLHFVADRVDSDANIVLELLELSRDDFEADVLDPAGLAGSALWRAIVGGPDAAPRSLVVVDGVFGPDARDATVLHACARMAARAVVPLVADAAPTACGLHDWREIHAHRDALSVSGSEPWRAFRADPDARF